MISITAPRKKKKKASPPPTSKCRRNWKLPLWWLAFKVIRWAAGGEKLSVSLSNKDLKDWATYPTDLPGNNDMTAGGRGSPLREFPPGTVKLDKKSVAGRWQGLVEKLLQLFCYEQVVPSNCLLNSYVYAHSLTLLPTLVWRVILQWVSVKYS